MRVYVVSTSPFQEEILHRAFDVKEFKKEPSEYGGTYIIKFGNREYTVFGIECYELA